MSNIFGNLVWNNFESACYVERINLIGVYNIRRGGKKDASILIKYKTRVNKRKKKINPLKHQNLKINLADEKGKFDGKPGSADAKYNVFQVFYII